MLIVLPGSSKFPLRIFDLEVDAASSVSWDHEIEVSSFSRIGFELEDASLDGRPTHTQGPQERGQAGPRRQQQREKQIETAGLGRIQVMKIAM